MKSPKVVFLMIIVLALLTLAYGMEQTTRTLSTSASVGSPQPAKYQVLLDLLEGGRMPWSQGSSAVLVIPSGDNQQSLENAEKDLNVMCRVFDKMLELPAADRETSVFQPYVSGIGRAIGKLDVFSRSLGLRGRNTNCMYLQGHAAVFFTEVDFPIAPADRAEDSEIQEPNEPRDSLWREVEQELYGGKVESKEQQGDTVAYDAKKLEDFKESLVKTLRHATNIGCLAPDEWVVVVVWGPKGEADNSEMMVVRAKKSDIDSYSRGNLGSDEFQRSVRILTFPEGK